MPYAITVVLRPEEDSKEFFELLSLELEKADSFLRLTKLLVKLLKNLWLTPILVFISLHLGWAFVMTFINVPFSWSISLLISVGLVAYLGWPSAQDRMFLNVYKDLIKKGYQRILWARLRALISAPPSLPLGAVFQRMKQSPNTVLLDTKNLPKHTLLDLYHTPPLLPLVKGDYTSVGCFQGYQFVWNGKDFLKLRPFNGD